MQNVTPRLAPKFPADLIRVAEEQAQYQPITVLTTIDRDFAVDPEIGHNTVIMAFSLSDDERKRIAEGEDIYISLLTLGGPQQGIRVCVGPEYMGVHHDLKVRRRQVVDNSHNAVSQADGNTDAPTDAEGPE